MNISLARCPVMKIADKGVDLVRITVQGRKEVDACLWDQEYSGSEEVRCHFLHIHWGSHACVLTAVKINDEKCTFSQDEEPHQ
jgi:4-hydroxy-3-methylbut-2-en-1-yl diphosphate synthase IspG/GcpE